MASSKTIDYKEQLNNVAKWGILISIVIFPLITGVSTLTKNPNACNLISLNKLACIIHLALCIIMLLPICYKKVVKYENNYTSVKTFFLNPFNSKQKIKLEKVLHQGNQILFC